VFNSTDEGPGLNRNVWNLFQVVSQIVPICKSLATQKFFTTTVTALQTWLRISRAYFG